jgi:spermidine synthase
MESRFSRADLHAALDSVALNSALRVLGCRLAGTESLKKLAAGCVVATDDLPLVLFEAPTPLYHPVSSPSARLETLLQKAEPDFASMIQGADAPDWVSRLTRYRTARDAHLKGLALEDAGRLSQALDEYVASASASPDYNGGYAQAILVASAYARQDPDLAKGVLQRLLSARPEERLARDLLERLR